MTSPGRVGSVALFLAVIGCARRGEEGPPPPSPLAYETLLAGHAYGSPLEASDRLYEPLRKRLPTLVSLKGRTQLVLLGDAVRVPTPEVYDRLSADLAGLGADVVYVPGNHEITTPEQRSLFEGRYGTFPRAVRQDDDVHLFLDSVIDPWNLSGPQLSFIESELAAARPRNVFLHCHHLVWLSPHLGADGLVHPNSDAGRPKETNFWSQVVPRLERTLAADAPVFVCVGDVGAWKEHPGLFYARRGRYHLIATGMGGGDAVDHVVRIRHEPDGRVTLRAVPLAEGAAERPLEAVALGPGADSAPAVR
ncbi:MAG TPA: hypothetical protein VEI02_09080 [Planctomycetota bacterium]|nr:hypothetical protein [Planctomycetota bacterium]